MKKLFIHAGFGKCGSSSIQKFLSHSEKFICTNQEELIYAACLADQRLLFGKDLTEWASRSDNGYRASVPFTSMKMPANDYFNAVGEQLLGLLQQHPVVLSQEGWGNQIKEWKKISFFSQHRIDVSFIFYIRPPVTWINSAWWQWGAWHDCNFNDWVSQQVITNVKFSETLTAFKALNWVNKVHVRLLDGNLLEDFSNLIRLDRNTQQPQQSISNKSLPNGILRLYQQHRRLRPGPHNSGIDFTLEKYLKLDGKADWVLEKDQIQHIIDETRASNLALIELIDDDCKADFLADCRYWQASAFENLVCKPANGIKPTYEELEQIALAGIDAVQILAAKQSKIDMKANLVFDNFSLWRDIALHVEKTNMELALSLMKQACILNPQAPFVNKKVAFYKRELEKKHKGKLSTHN
ncbi:MAG: hypothetical protein QX195_03885 [Methylococcaceae bacterium]|jgi:hypothetical protein